MKYKVIAIVAIIFGIIKQIQIELIELEYDRSHSK